MGAGREVSVVLLLQHCTPRPALKAETPLPHPQGRKMQRLPHLLVCFSTTKAEYKAVLLSPSVSPLKPELWRLPPPQTPKGEMRHMDREGCQATKGSTSSGVTPLTKKTFTGCWRSLQGPATFLILGGLIPPPAAR